MFFQARSKATCWMVSNHLLFAALWVELSMGLLLNPAAAGPELFPSSSSVHTETVTRHKQTLPHPALVAWKPGE